MKRGSGRPVRYKLADGTVVPGTTTITGRFKDAGGLIHWAYTQGLEGKDYRRTRDDAADAGTVAHGLIEATLHGDMPMVPLGTDEETEKRAKSALENFERWRETTKLEILETEQPYVSEVHRFGGTIDAVGTVHGKLCLVDWKTSAGVYPDYLCQTAAYVLLWEECRKEPITAIHLLRIDKEFGSFAHHQWGRDVIDHATQAFLLMRKLYDLDKMLQRAAA